MSKILRYTGTYNIVGTNTLTLDSPNVTITGNLTVQGISTTVESTTISIQDNIIVLNKNETGSGITLGTAGIEISRGVSSNAKFLFDETGTKFKALIGGAYAKLAGATPIDNEDFATKYYVDNSLSTVATNIIYQQDSNVTVTDSGSNGNITVSADNTLISYFNSTGFNTSNLRINSSGITNTVANGNILLNTTGIGEVVISNTATLTYSIAPTGEASKSKVYANTIGGGGTGLYFVSNTTSGELVSKSKAIIYALIF